MKPSSTRRGRRRYSNGPQQEQKKDQKFFGGETGTPFFQPGAINRAPEAKEEKKDEKISKAAEEKKEEKVSRAAADTKEEKKEEKISKAPAAPGDKEEKKEEKVSRAAAAPEEKKEEKKEEKVSRAPDPKEEQKEKKIERAAEDNEKKEEKDKKVSRASEPKDPEEKLNKKGEAGGAGESTVRYVEGINGKGQPLPSTEREFFGERMGYDFGAVRIHTGEKAAESARDAQAKAYTYGNHIVFSEGRYNPGSHEGRKLLAHELTHVVQKNGGRAKDAGPEKGGGGPSTESTHAGHGPATPGPVSRQLGGTTGTAAPGPTATDRAAFRTRMSIALAQMTTPTVAGETLSGTLEPVLRDMADQAQWVDVSGAANGGAEVSVRLSRGGRAVRLRMILDDTATPPLTGRFDSTGADLGTIRVYVRENGDADILATTMYHESLHLMRWLASNAPGGDLVAETGATGGRRMTLEGIDPARQPRHLAMVRRHVADLASSVNASRPASDQVDGGGIDRLSNFVMEEYLTRVETEVFRLMRDSDAASRTPTPSVRVLTAADRFFPRADVDKYLFEISSVFRAADRTALAEYDRNRINDLYEYFRDRVDMFIRRRYSEVIHGPSFP